MQLLDLFANILSLIFGNIPLREDINIKLTCKRFNQILYKPSTEYYSMLSETDKLVCLLDALENNNLHLSHFLLSTSFNCDYWISKCFSYILKKKNIDAEIYQYFIQKYFFIINNK